MSSYFGMSPRSSSFDIVRARIDLVGEQSALATLVVLLNTFILVTADIYFRAQVPIAWFTVMLLLVLIRFCLVWDFKFCEKGSDESLLRFGQSYLVATLVTGVLFGVGGIVLFDASNPTFQTLLVVILGGMAAGAVTILAAIPRLAGWYAALVLAPLTCQFLIHGSGYSYAIALLTTLLLLTMIRAANNSTQAITQALSYEAQERVFEEKLYSSQRELHKALESARTADIAKAAFLSTMGHELRTPLNGVIGMTDLVLDTQLTEEQKGYLELSRLSAHSLLRSINDVLDYANLEAGRLKLTEGEFSLHDVLSEISNFYQCRAEQSGVELHLVVDDSFPMVCIGDVGRIAQVLNNLVDNAIKFSDAGGIVLVLVLPDGDAQDEHFNVTFAVSDTGIGVNNDIGSITECFTQGEADYSTRKYEGSGLGLAIVEKLLDLLGSELNMVSIPGVGSRFSFTLEMESGWTADKQESGVSHFEQRSADEKHILIAEDNVINQGLYKAILADSSLAVTFAKNGREACQLVSENDFDLILMDCHMPVMNGLDATRRIRERTAGRQIPILALSAMTEDDNQEECLEAGMNGFIPKPVSRADLMSLVYHHLAQVEDETDFFETMKD